MQRYAFTCPEALTGLLESSNGFHGVRVAWQVPADIKRGDPPGRPVAAPARALSLLNIPDAICAEQQPDPGGQGRHGHFVHTRYDRVIVCTS